MIELKNVSKTFHVGGKKQTVLKNVSMKLPDHGLVFIVGQSGSGKSTILNCIGGLLNYDGEILYDGQAVKMENYRRKNVAYIFQDFLLFDELSVRDNIKIALEIAGIHEEKEISKRVSALLKAVNLSINPSRKAGALSLGQRQRVAISRALALSPKIILADEPTGNLDTKNSKNILSLLKSLAKDRLVLIVSHNMNLVRLYADIAYAIKDGGFASINPEEVELDHAYSENVVSIAGLEKEEIETDSLLVKLYSEKGGEKKTISIIQRNGSLYLVGDNVEVAKPEDVVEANNGPRDEEKVNDELLNFDEQKENKHLARKARWGRIKESALGGKKAKRKAIGAIYRSFEVIAPLAIFIAIDAMMLAFQQVDLDLGYKPSFEDTISFIGKKRESDTEGDIYQTRTWDYQDFFKIITEDSGIHSTNIGFADRDYGLLQFEVNSYLPISYGSAGNPEIIAKGVDFLSIDDFSSIASFSSLDKYDLADDEVVVPSKLLGKFADCPCFGGKKLKDAIIGTKIALHRPVFVESASTPSEISLKVIGVEDLPIAENVTPFFAKKETAEKLQSIGAASYATRNYAQSYFLPSFEDYHFYNLEDYITATISSREPMWILNKDYEYIDHTGPGGDPYVKDALMMAATAGLPIAMLSEAAYNDLPAGALASGKYFVEKLGGYSIKKKSAPDEKAIYFVIPSNFNPTAIQESRPTFFGALIANAVTYNHTTVKPEGATAEAIHNTESKKIEIVVPSIYKELSGPGTFDSYPALIDGLAMWQKHATAPNSFFDEWFDRGENENEMKLSIVGTYPSTSINDPIYISPLSEFYLRGNVGNFTLGLEAVMGENPEKVAYDDTNYFYSSNPQKTAKYFEDNLETFGVSSHTKKELYYSTVRSDYIYIYFDYLFPVGAVLVVILVLVMLNAAAKVNASKAGFGILRCLGKKTSEILGEDIYATIIHNLFFVGIPLAIVVLVLSLFDLYVLGFWAIPFFFGYMILTLIFSELPLILTLRRSPIDIMHSLQ